MNVNIIYASTSGNVEATVEFVARLLTYMGIYISMDRSELTDIGKINNNNKFIFATSTWDHGKINPLFWGLFESMQKHSFGGKQAAFIGLGDRRYEPVLFCHGMEQVRDLWIEKGGEEIIPALKINGEPYSQLSATVSPWTNLLAKIWAYKK